MNQESNSVCFLSLGGRIKICHGIEPKCDVSGGNERTTSEPANFLNLSSIFMAF
jgi:hypothetical protein